MKELDFTIEFNSNLNDTVEEELFLEADTELRKLAKGHDDITGAAINIREPAKGETSYWFEATVVVYSRPEHISATEKADDPAAALKGALKAVKRQIRERRTKLRQTWERPDNDPITQDMVELAAADEADLEETPFDEIDENEQ